MDNFVVTISREYGSGGHDIGKQLAELLQIPFYDKEIVDLTARKHSIDAHRLCEMEEDSKLPFSLAQSFGSLSESDEQLFILQAKTISPLNFHHLPRCVIGCY